MSNETEATAHRAPAISLDNPFKIQPETATEEGRYEATLKPRSRAQGNALRRGRHVEPSASAPQGQNDCLGAHQISRRR